jgi:hypothetical protein
MRAYRGLSGCVPLRVGADRDGYPDISSRHGSLGGEIARGGLAGRGGASGAWRGGLRWVHAGPGRLVSDDAGWHKCQQRRSAGAARPGAGVACVLDNHGWVGETRLGADGDARHAGKVLGTLAAPGGSGNGQGVLSASAIEVATSRDGRYAFVTLEYDQRAAVFNLAGSLRRPGRPRWDSAQRAAGHADADRPATGGDRP